MNFLGVDYGRSKMGVAWSNGVLSSPLGVIVYKSINPAAIIKIKQIVDEYKIEKIIVGVSEGQMATECQNFAKDLKEKLDLPVEIADETLTTHDAIVASIEAGMSRKKRKNMEDAFAASLMLQRYLENNL